MHAIFSYPSFGKSRSNATQRYNLHHAAYYALREKVGIGAQFACNAIRSVSAAYKTEFANHPPKKGEPIKAILFRNPSIHLDARTITYGKDGKTVSICSIDGRVRALLEPGTHQKQLLALGEKKESNLVWHPRRKDKPGYWALHISIEIPVAQKPLTGITPEQVLGVDVGENNIAAISSGRIWKAGKLKDRRDKFLGRRKRLQSNGSQSAKKHLKRASGKEKRFVSHVNHVVSKQIVQEAQHQGKTVIVLEDLTHIRDRIKARKRERARLHRWSFRELQTMIEYKAISAGMTVLKVDPHYTSQTCAKCGSLGNRHRHLFECPSCGTRAHSDTNASWNLQGLGYLLIAQGPQ